MISTNISSLFQDISNHTNAFGKVIIKGGSIEKKLFPNKKFGKKGFIHADCSYGVDGKNFKINLRIPNAILGESLESGEYDLYIESIFISNFGTVVANVEDILKVGESIKEIKDAELNTYCEDKGYFDIERKTLPTKIKNIVCITSFGGKLDLDIIDTIGLPKDKIKIYHCKSAVEIATKIMENQEADLIALFRGGHEDANMLMFSDKPVIEAVVNSEIPICAALGQGDENPFIYKIVDESFPTPAVFSKSIEYHEINSIMKKMATLVALSVPVILYAGYLFYEDILSTFKYLF